MKKILVTMCFVMLASSVMLAQKNEVFATPEGAIKGYDPVAFFTDKKPVMGKKDLTYTWNGATWHFANQQNLNAFKASPSKYAPQYGGYCAYGASEGHKAPTETDTWSVVNDKLYFNYNKDVQKEWNADQKARIEKADKQWPAIKDDK